MFQPKEDKIGKKLKVSLYEQKIHRLLGVLLFNSVVAKLNFPLPNINFSLYINYNTLYRI